MADLNLSDFKGTEFNLIGLDWKLPFSGVFDGQGHLISNFTYITSSGIDIGLFGCSEGQIRNFGLVGVHVQGRAYVGGLVGENYGMIAACFTSGIVNGYDAVGGLVGITPMESLRIVILWHKSMGISLLAGLSGGIILE